MFKKIFAVILESILSLSFYGALLSALADLAFTLLTPNTVDDGAMTAAWWFTMAGLVCLTARVALDLWPLSDTVARQRPAQS